jgi:hypothetical protein
MVLSANLAKFEAVLRQTRLFRSVGKHAGRARPGRDDLSGLFVDGSVKKLELWRTRTERAHDLICSLEHISAIAILSFGAADERKQNQKKSS